VVILYYRKHNPLSQLEQLPAQYEDFFSQNEVESEKFTEYNE
jgi:hypothetical protein